MFKNYLSSTVRFILIFAAFILLIVLNWKVWTKDYQQENVIKDLQRELAVQQQESDKLAKVNAELKQRIDSLKRGSVEMMEEKARNDFSMVGEDETLFEYEP